MKNLVKVTVASLGFLVAMASCTDDQQVVKIPTEDPVNKTVTQPQEVAPLDSISSEDLSLPDNLLPVNQNNEKKKNSENNSEITKQVELSSSDNKLTPESELKENYEDREDNKVETKSLNFKKVPDMGIMRENPNTNVSDFAKSDNSAVVLQVSNKK